MSKEVLKQVKAISNNNDITVMEVTTNKCTYTVQLHYVKKWSDKYGYVYNYFNTINDFIKFHNIDDTEYNMSNNDDILPFEQNMKVANIDIHNKD